MQDIMVKSIPFFSDIFVRNRKSAASLEACLFMLIKSLVYSVPMHTFLDYFQMSEEFGGRACKEVDAAIKQCYDLPSMMSSSLVQFCPFCFGDVSSVSTILGFLLEGENMLILFAL